MEETLKLILEKISAIDENQREMKHDIEQRLNKIDIAIENTIEPKISALFEARDISLHTTQTIMEDLKEVKADVSLLKSAVIKNTADIVDLKDYRKEN